jgi:hypothetical protein
MMKCVGKIVIWLAGGLLLSAGARADNTAVVARADITAVVARADNPYTTIVNRNIFGLNPVDPDAPSDVDPPPKITLNGIMSISKHLQALFKVAGTGKPDGPKDQSYILSEGQRQDDIEVTRINEQAGLVTFNNHGTVQEILLASTPGSATSGPGHGGAASKGNFSRPTGVPSGGNVGNGVANFSGRGGVGRSTRGTGNDANQNLNPSTTGGGMAALPFAPTPTRAPNADQQQNQNQNALTPEEAATLIELQRAAYKSENNPTHGILPVTKLTPPDAVGPTGNPLIMPAPTPAPAPSPAAPSK